MELKNAVLIFCGFAALIVGGVGVVVPILPTTPFVLLAAGCFGGSSPKLYKWLADTKYFGPFIENYRTKAGIKRDIKVRALIFLWVALLVSAFVFRQIHLWIILAVVGVGVSAHILLMKTKKE